MKSAFTFFVGAATLLGSAISIHSHPNLLSTNSTVTSQVHPLNATGCANITAPVITTTSLNTIYTSSPNSSVSPPSMYLSFFTASVDRHIRQASYDFKWLIEPDVNGVQCSASANAPHGNLADVQVAYCWQQEPWPQVQNYTAPAQFTFAWRHSYNGTVLILRSTNPGSAKHCPDFPHDACWAQALYWVPHKDIKRKSGVQVYVGSEELYMVGTYCKSGMLECAWSEYLY